MNLALKLFIFILIGCSLMNVYNLLKMVFSSPKPTASHSARQLQVESSSEASTTKGKVQQATPPPLNAKQPETSTHAAAEKRRRRKIKKVVLDEEINVPLNASGAGHRLAVIVPFRQAFKELYAFVPHMHRHLQAQGLNFTIFVINQMDRRRFNRGALLNAGVKELDPSYDYVVLHDVDLLPLRSEISYAWSPFPLHVSPPSLHPKYHFRKYSGGIVLLPTTLFRRVNGFSSAYWGWGKEDLDFAERLQSIGAPLRPMMLQLIGRHKARQAVFRHLHDEGTRERDKGRLPAFRNVVPSNFGLNNTLYTLDSRRDLHVEAFPYVKISVKLTCNLTPKRMCD